MDSVADEDSQMFVGDEVRLDIGFAAARERLLRLGEGDALMATSAEAYGPGLTRVGVAGVSKLVRVQARVLSWTDVFGRAGAALGGYRIGQRAVPGRWTPTSPLPRRALGTMLTLARACTGRRSGRWARPLTGRSCIGWPSPPTSDFLARVAAQLADQPVPNGAGSPETKT